MGNNILMILLTAFVCSCGAKELTREEKKNVDKQVSSNNITGLNLYKQLKEEKGNIVISPFSIGNAMTMALAGAEGDTRTEMAKVMHQEMDDIKMNQAAGNLHEVINMVAGNHVILESANGLCVTSPIVSNAYKQLLQKDYSAELFNAGSVKPINEWVKKRTKGRIPNILDKLPANPVCVILNAVYFKGLWDSQFKKNRTSDSWFFPEAEKKVKVSMMTQKEDFKLLQNRNYQVLAMPFKGKKICFYILLPNEGHKLSDLEESITGEDISSILIRMKRQRTEEIDVFVPRFKIEYKTGLIDQYKTLGMEKPFSAEFADFGEITGQKNALGKIWIAVVKHKAFLEINEEGGEAAAATAVVLAEKSAVRRDVFRADRPFLFFITDSVTDSILFMGRFSGPN